MTEQELKLDYDMFTSAWRFFKKYAVVEDKDNDEFWEAVVDESGAISEPKEDMGQNAVQLPKLGDMSGNSEEISYLVHTEPDAKAE